MYVYLTSYQQVTRRVIEGRRLDEAELGRGSRIMSVRMIEEMRGIKESIRIILGMHITYNKGDLSELESAVITGSPKVLTLVRQ